MLSFRPVTRQDDPFLCALYGTSRQQEMALTGWDAAQVAAFIRMQFDCRARSYALQFPRSEHSVILADGLPIGAWILDRRPTEIRVVDLAIVPEHRGLGHGAELMRRVQGEAGGSGRRVSLSVDRGSPAERLYRRLGFGVTESEDPVRLGMAWNPVPAPSMAGGPE